MRDGIVIMQQLGFSLGGSLDTSNRGHDAKLEAGARQASEKGRRRQEKQMLETGMVVAGAKQHKRVPACLPTPMRRDVRILLVGDGARM